MKECEWCTYKEKEFLLFETSYWKVYLADVQDYIGRCIVVLKRHCGNMSELNMQEWIELKEAIDVLELCFNSVLGAELCNWSCLMNSFYKDENPNPHLHMLEPGRIDHSESNRNNQSELIRNSQCTCMAN